MNAHPLDPAAPPDPTPTETHPGGTEAAWRPLLLAVAARSLRHGLDTGRPWAPDPEQYPEAVRVKRATFVTLTIDGALRGCIGMLEAIRPLVLDVAENAYAAAFRDPRFPPLTRAELALLRIEISVLSPAEPLPCASEQDLLARIRPGIDGLILEDRGHRGTFLPAVWEQLPRPELFLEQLRRKAGLAPDHWSTTLRVARYTTESFGAAIAQVQDADARARVSA
ncbi:MAG: AmmeMemoRadiSam system protein A [Sphingobacteriia bacterium]|nr:AmmeMemoRadiSam system protein A [Sphingobacteriia bacterium]NCC39846.1 AmmeMemoRadiSam system protein A [Gammaproteobacteria bacterium]